MKLIVLALILAMQQAPYSEMVEVRLHNVDVIVTDDAGTHVGGLRAEDFEILEDGKPQMISNFAEYAERVAPASPASAVSRSAAEGGGATLPPARKFIVFVDEMTIHPYTRKKFAASVSELVERAMRDEDQAAVVRPTTADKVALEFTKDRGVIRADVAAAMDASRYRTNSPVENEKRTYAIESAGMGGSRNGALYAARRNAERIRQRVEQRLGNLRALVAALARQDGRKLIVLLTESMPARPGEELFRFVTTADFRPRAVRASLNGNAYDKNIDYVDLTPVIEEIARSASANGITIYCLQPDFGIAPAMPPGGEIEKGASVAHPPGLVMQPGIAPITSANGAYADSFDSLDAIRNTETTMDVLTEKTGGKWFRGDSRVDDAFRQIRLDVQSYYSLAYRAEGTLDQPHRVAVRVKNRPELHVRTRSEVVRRSIRNEITDRVVASLVDAHPQNALGIAVRAGDIHRERRSATAQLDVLVPLDKLTFLREGDIHRARFTVHYAVSGERTDFVSGIEPEQLVEIPDADFAGVKGQHWRYTLTMNMRKGAHRVGVGVLDGLSQEYGITTVEVDAR